MLPNAGSVLVHVRGQGSTVHCARRTGRHRDRRRAHWRRPFATSRYQRDAIVSPDGQMLLVVNGSDVAVWDVASGTQRGLARQHTGTVLTMVWGADSRTFATTSDDRTTIVWDAATLRPVEVFSGAPGRQVQVGYSADGRSLYTAGQDGCVYLWDLTGTRREETQLDPAGPYAGGKIDPQNASAIFDPTRNRAIVTEGAMAYHVNVTTGKPIGATDPARRGAASVARPQR